METHDLGGDGPVRSFESKSSPSRAWRFPISVGMVPVRSLKAKESCARAWRFPISVGMVPVRSFSHKESPPFGAWRFPISVGMVPVRSFSFNQSHTREWRFPISVGMVPVRSLEAKPSPSRAWRFPISVGMVPVRSLKAKESFSSAWRFPISVGMVPVQVVVFQIELSDRSRHAVAGHVEPGIFAWVALEPPPVFLPPTRLRQAARRLVERDERLPFQVGAALEVASAIDVFLPTIRFRRDGGAAFLVQGRRRDVKQPQQQRGGERFMGRSF